MFPPIYDIADVALFLMLTAPAIFCGGVCWERERVKKARRRRYVRRSIR